MVILTIPWLGFKYYCYHFRFRRPASILQMCRARIILAVDALIIYWIHDIYYSWAHACIIILVEKRKQKKVRGCATTIPML